jgi:hypothetical protein
LYYGTKKNGAQYFFRVDVSTETVHCEDMEAGDRQMTTQTKIIGADFETNCDCCGRALKVGVQPSGLGVYGADCIRAAMPVDRKRYSQGRPDAATLRTYAKIAARDNAATIDRMGYTYAMILNVNVDKLEKATA